MTSATQKIDIDESAAGRFADRWKAARLRALSRFTQSRKNLDEYALLKEIELSFHEDVLRTVFDESRRCGVDVAKEVGRTLSVCEISNLISESRVSCFCEIWERDDAGLSRYLKRIGCPQRNSAFVCDYWREAADGLVMGLGDDAGFARHRSLGHGDDECLDFVYTAWEKKHQFGSVPMAIEEALTDIKEDLSKLGAEFTLIGFSEGVLFYRLMGTEGPLCGVGRKLLLDQLVKKLKSAAIHIRPNIEFRDVTPRPVLEGA